MTKTPNLFELSQDKNTSFNFHMEIINGLRELGLREGARFLRWLIDSTATRRCTAIGTFRFSMLEVWRELKTFRDGILTKFFYLFINNGLFNWQ